MKLTPHSKNRVPPPVPVLVMILATMAPVSVSAQPLGDAPTIQAKPGQEAEKPRAYASATVPLHDPVYLDLDRLDALGLLPEEVLCHRPLSRAEVARIVDVASRRIDAVKSPAKEILIRLRREFPVFPAGEPQGIQALQAGAVGSNAAPTQVRRNNGLGRIDAAVQPLFGYREGNLFAEGTTLWLDMRHAWNIGPHLVFGVRPDIRVAVGAGESYPFAEDLDADEDPDRLAGKLEGHFKALYGRLRIGQFILQVGRDALAFGPAPVGGILLSNNARPLDMVYGTHESSYRLPWIFRHLGPQRIGVAVADLGSDRVIPHSFLLATRGTFRLHRRLEFSIWDTLILGGEGAPKPAFFEIIHEIFPMGRTGDDEDLSDHRLAFDVRFHAIPGKLLVYHEGFLEDGLRPAPMGDVWDVMSFRSGFYLPTVGPKGRWDARFELTKIPAITYRHGRWASGYAVDRRLLGSELGPDSWSVSAAGRWNRDDGNSVSTAFTYESRNADLWDQEPTDEPDRFGDIFRLANHPTESRIRLTGGMDWSVSPRVTWQPRLSLERVTNAGFERGDLEINYAAELGLDVRFGKETR